MAHRPLYFEKALGSLELQSRMSSHEERDLAKMFSRHPRILSKFPIRSGRLLLLALQATAP